MTDWEILNIEPTDDMDQIKAAYFKALPHFHPEDDPEGFARLRESYERLMREGVKDSKSEPGDTPLDKWMEKVLEAYEDFSRRIRPDTWLALLKDDVCVALDSEDEASGRLLTYFMDHSYVPHECLAVLERHFSWAEKEVELKNEFPQNFVDYILANSKYPDHFRYSLFKSPEPGKNYDGFLTGYFQLQNLVQAGEYQGAGQLNEQLRQLGISHPDYIILQIQLALADKDFEQAKELCDELTAWRPDDTATWYTQANYHRAVNEPEDAIPFYRKIAEVNPEHVGALVGLGDAIRLGSPSPAALKEALSYYRRAEDILPYDGYIHDCIYSVSVRLADCCRQDCQDHPKDTALRIYCARMLAGTDQYGQGKAILEQTPKQDQNNLEYLLLMGDLQKGLKDPETALEYYNQAVQLPGPSEQISLAYASMGLCRMEQDRFEEALGFYEKGLTLFPDNLQLLSRTAEALNKLEHFQKALDVCNRGLALCEQALEAGDLNSQPIAQNPAPARKQLPVFWHYKAEALYKTGEYGQAIAACEQALSIAHNPETYLIQIKIYFNEKQYERVLEIIRIMQAQQVMDSAAAPYAMDSLRMLERYDEARKIAEQILDLESENKAVQAEIYFRLALVEKDQYNLDQALELAKKSFSLTPDKTFKRYLIADIYMEKSEYRMALAIYSSMLKQDPQDAFACYKIGEMYYNLDDPKRAERYYRKVLEIDPEFKDVHYCLADLFIAYIRYDEALREINLQLELSQDELSLCKKSDILLKLQRKDEAMATLKQALKIYPSGASALTNLALIYMDDGRYQEAADCLEKAIETC